MAVICALVYGIGGLTGCQLGQRNNTVDLRIASPHITAEQIQKPLLCTASAVVDEGTADLSITLDQCILEGLQHFRHPLGLHTVRYENATGALLCLFPPGLNRIEQVNFSRDLQAHLVKIIHTFWQYEASVQYEQLNLEQSALAAKNVSGEETKLGASANSLVELNRAKIQELDQSISGLSRHLPSHEVGDSQTHLRQLLALCGRRHQCDQAYLFEPQANHLKQIDYCLNCSIRSSVSHNPDLLLLRSQWISTYQKLGSSDDKGHQSWLIRKILSEHSRTSQSPLPNTAYDLACREQDKIELATYQLWQQIRAGREAYNLINDELTLLYSSLDKIDEAIACQQATSQDKIAVELNIRQTAMRGVVLSMRLGIASTQFLYQTGMLCDAFQIDFVNYWLTAEESRVVQELPTLPVSNPVELINSTN